MTDKFIGYFGLIDACDRAGCPVCRCITEDSRRALDAILYEHVTDLQTRRELRAAWGLCNWHAWSLLDAETVATSAAILYEDLVRECQHRVERSVDRRARSMHSRIARLRALVGGSSAPFAPPLVVAFRERPRCPVCDRLGVTEAAYLDTVADFADDSQFARAYQRSSGLCLPHLVSAVERNGARKEIATLIRSTLARWGDLRGCLERFVAKHEYRNTEPITDEEADSYRVATEVLSGSREIFANHMSRHASVIADLRAENERLRNALAAARRESGSADGKRH
jgi:Family of unknown function (DUF6062)